MTGAKLLRIGVVAALLITAQTANAQSSLPPLPEQFEGYSMQPISPTTVFQGRIDRGETAGGQLGYALVIRGAAYWWQAKTRFGDDSTAGRPAHVYVQKWEVGSVKYEVRYDARRQVLSVFGTEVDLKTSKVVLVTLGTTASDPVTVTLGAPVELGLLREEPLAPRMLRASEELRQFAGVP